MARNSRGGYVFVTWKRAFHVYRDGRLVLNWDLENQEVMKGRATRQLLSLIRELEDEGWI